MCTGGCAKCLGTTLIPLAVLCTLANILLFFPGGKVVENNVHITNEVWYFGGILGSGVLMIFPALVFLGLKNNDCCGCCGNESCGKRFAMFSSIIFAAVGVLGAGYCFVLSAVALNRGPKCYNGTEWTYPFQDGIVANILLYFPNGETRFASEHHLGKYVECLHGILGGGFLVLIPAAVFIGLHNDDCCGCFGYEDCGKSCAMLSSVLAAFVGILGSGYCIIISALGLSHGPYCFTHLERNWIYPFSESSGGYLFEYNKWSKCQEPQNIVQWNVTLFSILLVLGGIEFILCFIQIINGILGGLCGLCCSHEETYVC